MVPAYRIDHAVRFNDGACARRAAAAAQGRHRPRRHRLPAIHRRHDRRGQGRHAHARQPGRQHAAGVGMDRSRRARRRGSHRHRDSAVPHLRADRELPGIHEIRRLEPPRHQSARHAGIRQDPARHPHDRDHRRQHAVQRAAQHAWVRQGGFFRPAPDPGRRHCRPAQRRRTLEENHRRDPGRSLWPDRNLAGGVHESARSRRIQRFDRFADPVDRRRRSRRRRHYPAASAKPANCACAVRR